LNCIELLRALAKLALIKVAKLALINMPKLALIKKSRP